MPVTRHRFAVLTFIILNAAFAVPLIIYIGTGVLYTRYAYDDYCQAVFPREFGLLGGLTWVYNHVSGRFVAFFLNGILAPLGVPWGPVLTLSLVVVWWISLLGLVRLRLRSYPYPMAQAALVASVLITTAIACLPNIPMALYAYNGTSIYLTPVALFTLLMWFVFQPYIGSWLVVVICGLLAAAVSGSSDTAGVAQTLLLVAACIVCLARPGRDRRVIKRLVVSLCASLAALCVVLIAPANAVRAATAPPPDLRFALSIATSSAGAPLFVALYESPFTMAGLLILSFLAAYWLSPAVDVIHRKHAKLAILAIFVLSLVTIETFFVPVGLFLSTGLVAHAWLPPAYVLIVTVAALGYLAGIAFKRKQSTLPEIRRLTIWGVLALLVAVALTVQSVGTAAAQRRYAAAWDRRDADIRTRIKNGEGSTRMPPFSSPYYVLPSLPEDTPALQIDSLRGVSPYQWEADGNPTTVTNYCMARYYGIAAIVAEDK